MASHKVVRSPNGGERVRFWVDSGMQATLRRYAALHGISIHQAARKLLADGLAALPKAPHDTPNIPS